ncbi:MAG: hypothetical protein WD929_08575 [Steroidobacteraceae bacterium]
MRKFLLSLALLATGCAAPSQVPPPAVPPAAKTGAELPFEAWQVVDSLLEVRVYRDGPMMKLGHNHLISTDALAGVVELREPRTQSGFTLELPLDSLVVDDPAARVRAGADFAAPVPVKDREGTKRNMLGAAVLDASRQAVLSLRLDGLAGGPARYDALVRIGLRGEERLLNVPLTVEFAGDRMRIHAKLRLHHADLGLVPFTVALGALSVRDEFEIDCRLEARRRS